MYIPIKNFHNSNEVLYVLYSAYKLDIDVISKLSLQKLLYLSASLAPIKKVILSILKFSRWHRGPYSPKIQNTVDLLVAYGLVNISKFKPLNGRASTANYKISPGGICAVNLLKNYSVEREKIWWIDCVTRLADIYSKDESLNQETEFKGLDNIVALVYQENTFKNVDLEFGKNGLFNFENEKGITADLIKLTRLHVDSNPKFLKLPENSKVELILIAFFEQMFFNAILESEEG